MKVVAFPQTDGCGLYRLQLPIAALQRQGYDVTGKREQSITVEGVEYADGSQRPRRVRMDADVVVLQRPMSRRIIELIPILQRQGTAVVVEIDDDFHALPKGHPTKKDSAPIHSPDRNRRLLLHACEIADLVTVSTPALAERYGAHGRVRVLRNLIPASYLKLDVKRSGRFIGWTGSTRTHVDDLRVCGDGISRALDRTGWMFRTVGTGVGVDDQLELRGRPTDSTGWVPLTRYPDAYARLDLAIAPLQPNAFNEAKSWLKVLEAAALGVPIVASPTSEYRRAYELGLCELATTASDWFERCLKPMADTQLRSAQADLARSVAAGLTYEEHAWQWLEAYEQAVTFHRQKRAAAA